MGVNGGVGGKGSWEGRVALEGGTGTEKEKKPKKNGGLR